MIEVLINAIPENCWTILAVAMSGLILMIGLRIFRSGKVQVHAGNVEIDVESKTTVGPAEPPKP